MFFIPKSSLHTIQFNSKTLFKDGTPVSLKPIFPGAIKTYMKTNTTIIHTYIQNRFKSNLNRTNT